MMDIRFRLPREEDAAALSAIDAAGLATGHASFRSDPEGLCLFLACPVTNTAEALVVKMWGDQ